MIVRDMIERFQARVDDNVYWGDTRAKALANEIQDDLAQEFKIQVKCYYTFKSVQGQTHYEVPSNYISSDTLYFNSSYNQIITIMSGPKAIVGVFSDRTTEGIPTRGYMSLLYILPSMLMI